MTILILSMGLTVAAAHKDDSMKTPLMLFSAAGAICWAINMRDEK